MSKGKAVPDSWTPDLPHTDPRREKYCLSRSQGAGPSQAYKICLAADDAKSTSIKSAAHHVDREGPVASRIEFLRKAYSDRLNMPETLSGNDIRTLMHEVTDALELAHDVAEGSVASESDLSKIRQKLTVHIGRLARAHSSEHVDIAESKTASINVPPWCACECAA